MAISLKIRKLVLARDEHCLHCGTTDDTLVIQHRIGRGMGGSKLLDNMPNLMVICSYWNGVIESSAADAEQARLWGHKIPAWGSTNMPACDATTSRWWTLLEDGTRREWFEEDCF